MTNTAVHPVRASELKGETDPMKFLAILCVFLPALASANPDGPSGTTWLDLSGGLSDGSWRAGKWDGGEFTRRIGGGLGVVTSDRTTVTVGLRYGDLRSKDVLVWQDLGGFHVQTEAFSRGVEFSAGIRIYLTTDGR